MNVVAIATVGIDVVYRIINKAIEILSTEFPEWVSCDPGTEIRLIVAVPVVIETEIVMKVFCTESE